MPEGKMTLSLKPFDRGKARTPEQAMQDILSYNPQGAMHCIEQSLDASISEHHDRYIVRGIVLDENTCAVEWFKEPLRTRERHSVNAWMNLLRESEQKLPTLDVLTATLALMYNISAHADGQEKKAIESFQRYLLSSIVDRGITGTIITKQEDGSIMVKHNEYAPQQLNIEFRGKELVYQGDIFRQELKPLFGTAGSKMIAEAYKALAGDEPMLDLPTELNNRKFKRAVKMEIGFGSQGDGRLKISLIPHTDKRNYKAMGVVLYRI